MKTEFKKNIEKEWVLLDASNIVLGKLAVKTADLLRGKNKPYFAKHYNTGSNVVVVNALKVKISEKKLVNKMSYHYSGFPSGMTAISMGELMKKDPRKVVYKAVKGMLPKNKLQKDYLSNLHVYIDENHKYIAQKPQVVNV
jgi:large subunit ribosomal protein L13